MSFAIRITQHIQMSSAIRIKESCHTDKDVIQNDFLFLPRVTMPLHRRELQQGGGEEGARHRRFQGLPSERCLQVCKWALFLQGFSWILLYVDTSHTQSHKQREKTSAKEREGEKKRKKLSQKHKHTHTHTQTKTHTHTHTQTHTHTIHTHTHTHKQTEMWPKCKYGDRWLCLRRLALLPVCAYISIYIHIYI